VRLTKQTDYALRVLIHVGLRDGERVRLTDIAETFAISRNHLMKVVHRLGSLGYIRTLRGRNGGLLLARPAETIRVGDVVRDLEDDLRLVECFPASTSACRIEPACVLKRSLEDALRAFMDVLDQVSLADLLKSRHRLQRLLAFEVNGNAC
jgi:Rrf2 family nitric oxide-sensitive transcriptional repressor